MKENWSNVIKHKVCFDADETCSGIANARVFGAYFVNLMWIRGWDMYNARNDAIMMLQSISKVILTAFI